jgi:hypothetical protein
MQNNEPRKFSKEELEKLKATMPKVLDVFIEFDPAWKSCGKSDYLGFYSFLKGPRRHTMAQAIERVQPHINIIETIVAPHFAIAA